jgi:hypothetical protein
LRFAFVLSFSFCLDLDFLATAPSLLHLLISLLRFSFFLLLLPSSAIVVVCLVTIATAGRNFYDVLEVAKDASAEQVCTHPPYIRF